MITFKEAHDTFRYDPVTGKLYWRVDKPSRVRAGDEAGSVNHVTGYRRVKLNQKEYLFHRLIWFMVQGYWPPHDVDHVDMDKLNNAFDNLRLATRSQNKQNTPLRSNNPSGFKGVRATNTRFSARINLQGRNVHLGTFDTPQEAHAVYCAAADKHFGEFANHG